MVAIEPNRNSTILFCTGIDKKAPGLAVAKARVNRGFGFIAHIPNTATWTYNSTIDKSALAEIIDALAELDTVVAASFRDSMADGMMVGPGEEYSLGLSEKQIRDSQGGVALRLDPQALLPFLVTVLAQIVTTDGMLRVDGYVAATMALAKCGKDIASAKDMAGATKASLSCLGGIDEAIAKQLATYLMKRGVQDAGKLAGQVIGKMVVALAVIGPVFNAMNYWGEQSADLVAARTVTMFPKASVKTTPVTFNPNSTGRCKAPCKITGKYSFQHQTFGSVTLFTLAPETAPGESTAVLVDARGNVRWWLPGTADERRQYEFSLANPATDATGLVFINYNPGRYNGVSVLRPDADGMEVLVGWYDYPIGQDLYYASLEGPGPDGRYTIIKSENDCKPSCAAGTTTSVRLHWNGNEFVR